MLTSSKVRKTAVTQTASACHRRGSRSPPPEVTVAVCNVAILRIAPRPGAVPGGAEPRRSFPPRGPCGPRSSVDYGSDDDVVERVQRDVARLAVAGGLVGGVQRVGREVGGEVIAGRVL